MLQAWCTVLAKHSGINTAVGLMAHTSTLRGSLNIKAMYPDTICTLKTEILDLVNIIAAAAIRLQAPCDDEVTTRRAWREFGRTWLEYQVSRDRVKSRRKGPYKNSPVVFSRTELLALKEAERRGAKMVRK
jgi:hypothetical protein